MDEPMTTNECPPQVPGCCTVCGHTLTGRRTRYCSKQCSDWWYANHWWGTAREVALRRDGRLCVRCGASATDVDHIRERKGTPKHRPTCLHHQDNLRSLCHDCHVKRRLWDVSETLDFSWEIA